MTKFTIFNFKNLRYNSIFLTFRCLPITEERAIFSFITKRNDTLKLCKIVFKYQHCEEGFHLSR